MEVTTTLRGGATRLTLNEVLSSHARRYTKPGARRRVLRQLHIHGSDTSACSCIHLRVRHRLGGDMTTEYNDFISDRTMTHVSRRHASSYS